MKTASVYKIKNLINGKVYIGQSSNIAERWYRHSVDYTRLTDKYLYRAMNKYGFENFEFTILEKDISINEISKVEQEYIVLFNSMSPNGYNMTNGGEGTFRVMSEETRQKLVIANIGKKHSEKSKEKMSNSQTVRYSNLQEREKMSVANRKNEQAMIEAGKRISNFMSSMNKQEKELHESKRVEGVKAKLGKKVIATNIVTQEVLEFKSFRDASAWLRSNTEYTKACHTNISKVTRGLKDNAYGFIWTLSK